MTSKDFDLPQCRICYENEEENKESLISPCSCIGSLRYIHASCLNRWRALNIENRNRNTCQLCLQPYRIHKDGFLIFSSDPVNGEVLLGFLTKQYAYNIFIRSVSILLLAPLSLATSGVSQITTYRKQVQIPPVEQFWDQKTLGFLFGKGIVTEVNKLIESKREVKPRMENITWRAAMVYGLTKLGYYGCTWWLFSDGLSDALPAHINAQINNSSLYVLLKALVEFYIIPSCLATPSSRPRLVFYTISTLIGILFILRKLEKKIRKVAIALLPNLEEFELGRYADL